MPNLGVESGLVRQPCDSDVHLCTPVSCDSVQALWEERTRNFRAPRSAPPSTIRDLSGMPKALCPDGRPGFWPQGEPPADATLVSMAVEPLDEVRNHLSDVIDRVELRRERVTVTRDGRPVAVILSPEDLAELEETLSVLSDSQALPDIREADAAFAAGDVVRGVDAVRALRP